MKMPSARARSLLYSTRSRAIALVVSRACPRISDGAEEHDTRRNSNTPRETRTPTPHKRDKALNLAAGVAAMPPEQLLRERRMDRVRTKVYRPAL